MKRYDPFEKLSDLYDSIVDWENDPLIKPENQNKYFFSDGKTYYEQLCKILKLLSTFKNGFDQIYDNLDELEQQITESGVTKEELNEAIDNLHTLISSEIALVESSLSSDINDVESSVTDVTARVTASEEDISSLQTLTASHTTDIASLQTATNSLNTRMGSAETNISALQTLVSTHTSDIQTINTAISSIQQSLATKIGDAPMDGKTYGRKNGSWNEVTGGGGGTSDYDALSNKPQINGNTLSGNKTGNQLGLVDASALASYISKSEAPGYNDILTNAEAQAIYQTILAMSDYLLKNDAPGYADILTKTDASSLYQTILGMSNYLLKQDAPGYNDILTQSIASATYQTITAMTNYLLKADAPGYADILTKTDASSLYQTILGMSNYLLKQDAPGYDDILTETEAQAIYQTIANMSNYVTNNTIAGSSQLGLVKVGNGLSIDANGVLSASGSGIVLGNPITLTPTVNKGSITSHNLILRKSSDGRYFCLSGYIIVKGAGSSSLDNAVTMSLNESVKAVATQKREYGFATSQNINTDMIMSSTYISIETSGALKFHYLCTSNNTSYWFNGSVIDVDSL